MRFSIFWLVEGGGDVGQAGFDVGDVAGFAVFKSAGGLVDARGQGGLVDEGADGGELLAQGEFVVGGLQVYMSGFKWLDAQWFQRAT